MITEILHIFDADKKEAINIPIKYQVIDWGNTLVAKQLGFEHPKWLIEYDHMKGCVCIDINAPKWYAKLAGLHEMIFVGHKYEYLIPGLEDDQFRCQQIEAFILTLAGPNLAEYVEARKKMYQDFFIHGGYRRNLETQMRNDYEFLRGVELSV